MKRVQSDIFIEDNNFDSSITNALNVLKAKATGESSISYHDCGHVSGGKCKNVVEVL